jgi:hypothetical protein
MLSYPLYGVKVKYPEYTDIFREIAGWAFNPEFAVAIYYGLQILAATLVYCFYHPVLLTGPQRETIGTFVPLLFHPLDEI